VAISPKLRSEASWFSWLFSNQLSILGIDDFIADSQSGWRQCEEVDAMPPANRAGFCWMQCRHAIAMLDFGQVTIEGAANMVEQGLTTSTAIQFVLAHSDDGTCNDAAVEVLGNLQQAGSPATACIMPEPVPHSMFSFHDSPYDKPWVPPLFDAVEQFVLNGTPVAGSSDQVNPCTLTW
jgi:hypothetical protein